MRIDRNKYEAVASGTAVTDDVIVPDGESWEIRTFTGNAAYVSDVAVCLVWDRGGSAEEVLAATHGDATITVGREITGDGTKKLSIMLDNQSSETHTIGAGYTGVVLV